MKKDYKVIFVHGISGSSRRDFFPVLIPELQKLHIDFEVSNFPGGFLNAFPKVDKWIAKLHEIVQRTDKPIIFVGFSLGTRAILLYLEKYPIQVDKVILISALANDLAMAKLKHGRVKSFWQHTIDVAKIKTNVKSVVQIHSKDDKASRYEWGKSLAKELGSTLITLEGKGHFTKPKNAYDLLPILKQELSTPKIFVIFGLPGAGKTYVSKVFETYFGFYFYDGDRSFTPEIKHAIKMETPFTDPMRDIFFNKLTQDVKEVIKKHEKVVIAQTFIKEKYRKQFLKEIPAAQFILVRTKHTIRQNRLEKRKEVPLSKEYAEQMVRNFEEPKIPYQVIDNDENGVEKIRKQIYSIIS